MLSPVLGKLRGTTPLSSWPWPMGRSRVPHPNPSKHLGNSNLCSCGRTQLTLDGLQFIAVIVQLSALLRKAVAERARERVTCSVTRPMLVKTSIAICSCGGNLTPLCRNLTLSLPRNRSLPEQGLHAISIVGLQPNAGLGSIGATEIKAVNLRVLG